MDTDGTNEPIPFGEPSDVKWHGDRIRVSSDPAVLERLRRAAPPVASNPPDLHDAVENSDGAIRPQTSTPVVSRATQWTADQQARIEEGRSRLETDLLAALDLMIEKGLLVRRPGREQTEEIYLFAGEQLSLWDLLPAFVEVGCAVGFDTECAVDSDERLSVGVVRHDTVLIDQFVACGGRVFHPSHVSQAIREWMVFVRFVFDGRAYEAQMTDYSLDNDFCDADSLALAANCALWESGKRERFVLVPSPDQGAYYIFTDNIDALRALEASGLVETFSLDSPIHFLSW